MKFANFMAQAGVMLLVAGVLAPSPASAQADPQVQGPPAPPKIVPNCRRAGTDEIVVCGRGERSPYRLPITPQGFDPDGDGTSISRERNGLMDEGGGGIGSCSAVGPGGGSGCMAGGWKRKHEQSDGHGRKKGLISKVRDRDDPDPVPEQ
jgi:hypothetical protein